MRPFVASAWVLLAVAGCIGSSDRPAEAPSASVALAAEFTDTLGAVTGLVLDSSLLPIPNATVGLYGAKGESAPAVTTTMSDAGGQFGFSRIDPGEYTVLAIRLGYASGASHVRVAAGQAVNTQLILDELASKEPYQTTIIRDGFLSCAPAILLAPTNNRCPGDNSNSTIKAHILDGFQYILSESKWNSQGSSEELSQYFYTLVHLPNGKNDSETADDVWGQSVLRAHFFPGENKSKPSLDTGTFIVYAPVPKGEFNLTVTSYYAGIYAEEINQSANRVCRVIYDRCAGVGMTLGLRYTQYLSIFMFGLPPDIERYSAVPDG